MYINATGFYIPTQRIDNAYFFPINGLSDEWMRETHRHPHARAPPRMKTRTRWLSPLSAMLSPLCPMTSRM